MKKKPMILIDTREQRPWEFKDHRTKPQKLSVGDYTLYGYSKLIAVERKTLNDFAMRIGKMDDFKEKQLNKLKELRHSIIIIEGDPSVMRWGKYSSPESVISGAVIVTLYGVPVLFAGTRDMASFACSQFLEMAKKLVDLS